MTGYPLMRVDIVVAATFLPKLNLPVFVILFSKILFKQVSLSLSLSRRGNIFHSLLPSSSSTIDVVSL